MSYILSTTFISSFVFSPQSVSAIVNFSKNKSSPPTKNVPIHAGSPDSSESPTDRVVSENGYESDCESDTSKHVDPDSSRQPHHKSKLGNQCRSYLRTSSEKSTHDDSDDDLDSHPDQSTRPKHTKPCCEGGYTEYDRDTGSFYHICAPKENSEDDFCREYDREDSDYERFSGCDFEKGFGADDSQSDLSSQLEDDYYEEAPCEDYSDYEDEQGNHTNLYEIHKYIRIRAQSKNSADLIRKEMDKTIAKAEYIVRNYREKFRRSSINSANQKKLLHFKFVVKALYEAAICYSKNIHPLETKEDCKKEVYLNIYREILQKMEKEYLAKHLEYSSVLLYICVSPKWDFEQLYEDSFWNIFYMSRVWLQTSTYLGQNSDFANKIFTEYIQQIVDITFGEETFEIKPLYS